ncbi:acyl-CoA thioesterase [bacterium]|nr:acyl-CoA thioesterase [bacterium]
MERTREIRRAEPLETFEVVFPQDLNPMNTMFGGAVVALMDKAAGIVVSRWARRIAVTASIDAIQFLTPLRQGQMIEIHAQVAYVGKSSCMARVQVWGNDIGSGDRHFCCEGFFTMVSMDSNFRPVALPMIPVETEEEKQLWDYARQIKQAMLERREQARSMAE